MSRPCFHCESRESCRHRTVEPPKELTAKERAHTYPPGRHNDRVRHAKAMGMKYGHGVGDPLKLGKGKNHADT